MPPRKLSMLDYEADRAMLSLAGVRQVNQTTVTAVNGASTAYTVTGPNTRRVIVIHLNAGNGDIRFNYNAAATSSNLPVIPARYFIVDAKKDDTLNFWNTTAGNITVNVMEVE